MVKLRRVLSVLLVAVMACVSLQVHASALYSDAYIKTNTVGVGLSCNDELVSYYYVTETGSERVDGSLWLKDVSSGDRVSSGSVIDVDRPYSLDLSVDNMGTIDTFNRVSICRNFVDSRGDRIPWLNFSFINISLPNLDTYFVRDAMVCSDERTVLYYDRVLDINTSTPLFLDDIMVSDDILLPCLSRDVVASDDGDVVEFHDVRAGHVYVDLTVTVESVQDHNADQAIISAWGRYVSVYVDDDGIYRLELIN